MPVEYRAVDGERGKEDWSRDSAKSGGVTGRAIVDAMMIDRMLTGSQQRERAECPNDMHLRARSAMP